MINEWIDFFFYFNCNKSKEKIEKGYKLHINVSPEDYERAETEIKTILQKTAFYFKMINVNFVHDFNSLKRSLSIEETQQSSDEKENFNFTIKTEKIFNIDYPAAFNTLKKNRYETILSLSRSHNTPFSMAVDDTTNYKNYLRKYSSSHAILDSQVTIYLPDEFSDTDCNSIIQNVTRVLREKKIAPSPRPCSDEFINEFFSFRRDCFIGQYVAFDAMTKNNLNEQKNTTFLIPLKESNQDKSRYHEYAQYFLDDSERLNVVSIGSLIAAVPNGSVLADKIRDNLLAKISAFSEDTPSLNIYYSLVDALQESQKVEAQCTCLIETLHFCMSRMETTDGSIPKKKGNDSGEHLLTREQLIVTAEEQIKNIMPFSLKYHMFRGILKAIDFCHNTQQMLHLKTVIGKIQKQHQLLDFISIRMMVIVLGILIALSLLAVAVLVTTVLSQKMVLIGAAALCGVLILLLKGGFYGNGLIKKTNKITTNQKPSSSF